MNNGLLLGLGALVVGGGIAWLAFNDDTSVTHTGEECWQPGNIDAWGKAGGQTIIILNWDGTFYAVAGAAPSASTKWLVWKDETQQFRTTPDDDWDGAQASPPQPFPWNQAPIDRIATVNFTDWCKAAGLAQSTTIANASTLIGSSRNQTTPNGTILLNFEPIDS